MSALSMPTCGRPGSVSSILTAIVGEVGTAPIPVKGLVAPGFGMLTCAVLPPVTTVDDDNDGTAVFGVDFLALLVQAVASRAMIRLVMKTSRRVRAVWVC